MPNIKPKTMTRMHMIEFLQENHNVPVKHFLFDESEFIYSVEDQCVYDENGYLFEDWHSIHHDGIRIRKGGVWEDGWSLVKRK